MLLAKIEMPYDLSRREKLESQDKSTRAWVPHLTTQTAPSSTLDCWLIVRRKSQKILHLTTIYTIIVQPIAVEVWANLKTGQLLVASCSKKIFRAMRPKLLGIKLTVLQFSSWKLQMSRSLNLSRNSLKVFSVPPRSRTHLPSSKLIKMRKEKKCKLKLWQNLSSSNWQNEREKMTRICRFLERRPANLLLAIFSHHSKP